MLHRSMSDVHVLSIIFTIIWIYQSDKAKTSALTSKDLEQINELVEAAIKCRHFPGISLAVVDAGEIVLQRGYGYADIEKNIKLTSETLVPVASTTKAFTTMVLAMLLQNSKFSWDTPIKDIFPSFKMYNDLLTRHVTLRDILTHKTGIPDYFLTLMAGYPENSTMEEIVRMLHYHPPSSEFRTSFLYNNYMYALAGYIVELLANMKWENIIQTRIFQPLGMNYSDFVTNIIKPGIAENVARPYVYWNEQLAEIDLSTIAQVNKALPAGGILSNAKDMSKWLQFLLQEGQLHNDTQLISRRAFYELFDTDLGNIRPSLNLFKSTFPVSDVHRSYVLGWVQNIYRGYRRSWHSGGILTFKTQLWFFPDIGSGIFIASNGPQTHGSSYAINNVAHYISDLLISERPWLDTQTICTFPGPWRNQTDKNRKNTHISERLQNDELVFPFNFYLGDYIHPAFGKITIAYNASVKILHMNMGRLLEADLFYEQQTDVFTCKPLNKYWYLKERIPLQFNLLTDQVGGTKTFTVIRMPLAAPYELTPKISFVKDMPKLIIGSSSAVSLMFTMTDVVVQVIFCLLPFMCLHFVNF